MSISPKISKTILAIYSFKSGIHDGEAIAPPVYYLVKVLDEKGPMENYTLIQSWNHFEGKNPPISNEGLGPFQELSEIEKFLLFLGQNRKKEKEKLISIDEYNEILEMSSNLQDLKENLFERSGGELARPVPKKKSIVERFFRSF